MGAHAQKEKNHMAYIAEVREQNRQPARPAHYKDLLFQPVAADPLAFGALSYHDWEFDHVPHQRFRVAGLRWFMRLSGITTTKEIVAQKIEAVKLVKEQTNWASLPVGRGEWDYCSAPQFGHAANRKPMLFQKCALVIAACELALQKRMADDPSRFQSIDVPQHVYTHMSIIPCVWNLNDFGDEQLKILLSKYPTARTSLANAAGQEVRKQFLEAMTVGHTVSYRTASGVKNYINEHFNDVPVGEVRVVPGSFLGRLKATEQELVDVDGE